MCISAANAAKTVDINICVQDANQGIRLSVPEPYRVGHKSGQKYENMNLCINKQKISIQDLVIWYATLI